MKRITKISVFFLCSIGFIGQSQTTWSTLTEKIENPNEYEEIDSNPLRGFCPSFGYDKDFPSGVEKFYFPVNRVYPNEDGVLNWTAFDNKLNDVISRGQQAIPRFWLNYPGRNSGGRNDIESLGMPHHLDDKVDTWQGTVDNQTGELNTNPDYNDEDLILFLEEFIAAYGARYHDDPRIGFVDVGLYGFYGEWHVFGSEEEQSMTQTNRARLIQAYLDAFPVKKVMLRTPKRIDDPNIKNKLGYFDDSFVHRTINKTGRFWEDVKKDDLSEFWKTFPMGGEVYPGIELEDIYGTFPFVYENGSTSPTEYQPVDDCIKITHATWMVDHSLFANNLTANQKENALKLHRLFGYRFFMNQVKINPLADGTVFVEMKIDNKGIAPFYYDWDVEFAYVNVNNSNDFNVIATTSDFNISEIMPIEVSSSYSREILTNPIPNNGTYKILMRIVSPIEGLTPNAKKIRFANTSQDADIDTWLTLGTANINASNVVSVTGVTSSPSNTSVNVGENTQVSASVSPANASVNNIIFSSNDESIATVDSAGKVFGIREGMTIIKATSIDGDFEGTTNVSVTPINVTSVALAPLNGSNTININNSIQLAETVQPTDATYKDVIWSSSDSNIISVDANGLLTGKSSGNATITVTTVDGNFTDFIAFTVQNFQSNNESAIVNYERWDAIVGSGVSSLTNNENFPNSPSSEGELDLSVDNFRANNIGGTGDNYGVRISAHLVAPETGTYYFYLTADDYGELSLSPNATQASKAVIAYTDYVPEAEWYYTDINGMPLAPNQKSVAIELIAGNTYYIEAIMKEKTFGDHIAVGWRKPSDGDALLAAELVPGSVLKAYDSTLSIDSVQKQKIALYPNPAKDVLHININSSESYTLSLLNILGKQILTKNNLSGNSVLNIEGINPGIYFARITTKTSQTVKKVIIK